MQHTCGLKGEMAAELTGLSVLYVFIWSNEYVSNSCRETITYKTDIIAFQAVKIIKKHYSVEFCTGVVMGTNLRYPAGFFGDEKVHTPAGIEVTGVNIVGIPR